MCNYTENAIRYRRNLGLLSRYSHRELKKIRKLPLSKRPRDLKDVMDFEIELFIGEYKDPMHVPQEDF